MKIMTKIIMLWYYFLTFFAIFGGSKLSVFDLFGGIVLMWFIFFVFNLGFNAKYNRCSYVIQKNTDTLNFYSHRLGPLALVSIVASLYSAHFYTGLSIFDVYLMLFTGESLYNSYQHHFNENEIALFSIKKIPAIVSMVLMKFILLASSYIFFIRDKGINRLHIFYYFSILASYLFFALSRGTSFEIFEIIILIIFCRSFRQFYFDGGRLKIFTFSNLTFILIIFLALLLYNYNIDARYGFLYDVSGSTREIIIDKSSLLYFFSPSIAEISIKLSGYFTFGLYFTSTFIYNIWIDSWSYFFTYLIPFSTFFILPIRAGVCNIHIDCGASWIPDVIILFQTVGFIALLSFIFILGYVYKIILKALRSSISFEKITLLFFVFLTMISLPIGNFIFASSSNIVLMSISIALIFYKKFLRRFFVIC